MLCMKEGIQDFEIALKMRIKVSKLPIHEHQNSTIVKIAIEGFELNKWGLDL